MYRLPHSILVSLFVLSLWIGGTTAAAKVEESEEGPTTVYCPSYCDEDGIYHGGDYCILPKQPFCCLIKDELRCCGNRSSSVSDTVTDDYNCKEDGGFLALYWKTILGVCLPLALISVTGAITLCSIQHIRMRRRQRQIAEMERQRSNSAMSTISGTSSCSLRAPPSPIVVLTSHHDSPITEYLRINGLRIPLEPPPYTPDKPPPYCDIMAELDGFSVSSSYLGEA